MATTTRGLLPALAAALILCFAGAAAAQDVRYNFKPGTDFTKFKTYKWVKIEGAQYPNDIVDSQIKTALEAALTAKGLAKTEAETADLYIGYQVALNSEKQWSTYGTSMGWGGYGAGWRYGGGGMATTTSSTIYVGTLGVDIYDAPAKQLIWRGSASKTIDENAKPDKRQKNLNKAATKLLKDFPPKEKK